MKERRRRKSTGIKSSGAEIKTVSGGVAAVLKAVGTAKLCLSSIVWLDTITLLIEDAYRSRVNTTLRCISVKRYVNKTEKDYVSIQKASGYVYACANMLYQRVKTKGNVKYLKCSHENCDGSACASTCTLSIMHNNNNLFYFTCNFGVP